MPASKPSYFLFVGVIEFFEPPLDLGDLSYVVAQLLDGTVLGIFEGVKPAKGA